MTTDTCHVVGASAGTDRFCHLMRCASYTHMIGVEAPLPPERVSIECKATMSDISVCKSQEVYRIFVRVNYRSPDCHQLSLTMRSNNSGRESILSVNRKYHDSCLFNLFINDRCSTCYSNTDILRACSGGGEGKTLPGPRHTRGSSE